MSVHVTAVDDAAWATLELDGGAIASVEASRMSMGNCMVTPIPTAAPLIAPITGFLQS